MGYVHQINDDINCKQFVNSKFKSHLVYRCLDLWWLSIKILIAALQIKMTALLWRECQKCQKSFSCYIFILVSYDFQYDYILIYLRDYELWYEKRNKIFCTFSNTVWLAAITRWCEWLKWVAIARPLEIYYFHLKCKH